MLFVIYVRTEGGASMPTVKQRMHLVRGR